MNNVLFLLSSITIIVLASLIVLLLRSGPVEVDEAEAHGPLGFRFRLKGFRKKGDEN